MSMQNAVVSAGWDIAAATARLNRGRQGLTILTDYESDDRRRATSFV